MSHSNPLILNDNNKIATSNPEDPMAGAERALQSAQPSFASAFLALGVPLLMNDESRFCRVTLASLIARGADVNASCYPILLLDVTFLGAFISAGDAQVVELLLEHGADPSLPSCRYPLGSTSKKYTPFTLAVLTNNLRIIQLLVEYSKKPKEGLGPIERWVFQSILKSSPETARQLIEKNAVTLLGDGKLYSGVLFDIMMSDDLTTIQYALQKLQLSVTALEPYLAHGLEAACRTHNRPLGRYMVQCGAKMNTIFTISSYEYWGRPIPTYYHSLFPDDHINEQDAHGDTILHKLAKIGDENGIALVIERGANPLIRNFAGLTPFACEGVHHRQDKWKDFFFKQYISQRRYDFLKIWALAEASPFCGVKVNYYFELQIAQKGKQPLVINDRLVEAKQRGAPIYVLAYQPQDNKWVLMSVLSVGYTGRIFSSLVVKRFSEINLSEIPGLEALIDGKTVKELSTVDRQEILKKMAEYNYRVNQKLLHFLGALPPDLQSMVVGRAFMAPVFDRAARQHLSPSRSHAVEVYKKLRDKAKSRAEEGEQPEAVVRGNRSCVMQ